MKKILCFLLFTMYFSAIAQKVGKFSDDYYRAQKMLQQKDYFRARDFIQSKGKEWNDFERLVLGANIDNLFNHAALSNEKADRLLKKYSGTLGDSLMLAVLRLKHDNHARLFQYADAYKTATEVITKHKSHLTDLEYADFLNMAQIWQLLAGQPAQKITSKGVTIKMSRDKAGLTNLSVRSGDARSDFIFDTGANLSTVTLTTAQRFGMRILGGKIEVGSITGTKVGAQIAVCPKLAIGEIVVENVVFLIFPDEALAFPQIEYQINGIIGFPVIEAMGEIQVTQDDEFIVPTTFSAKKGQEMALDFLNPVISIDGDAYTFDTGATGTSLYRKYFEKHKERITANYSETSLDFGGAGGAVTKTGYKVVFTPTISGRKLQIPDVQLFTDRLGDEENYFYGNIGQDIIRQFRKMTINFRNTFVSFD